MSDFLQGKPTQENRAVKHFGYILSALFLSATGIASLGHSSLTPWLFLITMYLLTGSLWLPVLIKPFYKGFMRIRKK